MLLVERMERRGVALAMCYMKLRLYRRGDIGKGIEGNGTECGWGGERAHIREERLVVPTNATEMLDDSC